VLRKAFLAALKDPELMAEAAKQNLEIDAISGEEITKLLVELYETPKETVELVNGFRTGRAGEREIKPEKP